MLKISAFVSSGLWIWCRRVQEPEDYYWWTSRVTYMSSKPLRVQTSMSRNHWPDRSLWSLVYRASDRSRGCRGCAWTRGGSWRRPWCWTWPGTCSSLSEVLGGQMQVCIKFIVGQFEKKNIDTCLPCKFDLQKWATCKYHWPKHRPISSFLPSISWQLNVQNPG